MRSAGLRADLYPVEPKPGSSGTPGLRQSGIVFFFCNPALIPQRAVRASETYRAIIFRPALRDLGAWNFQIFRGLTKGRSSVCVHASTLEAHTEQIYQQRVAEFPLNKNER